MNRKMLVSLLVLLLALAAGTPLVHASAETWRSSNTDWLYVHWSETWGRPTGIPAGAFNIEVEQTWDISFTAIDQFIYAGSHGGQGIFRRKAADAGWTNLGRPGGSSADQFFAISPYRTLNDHIPGLLAGVVSASAGRRGLYSRLDGGSWARHYSANSVAHVGGRPGYVGINCYFITTNSLAFHFWEGIFGPEFHFIGPFAMGTMDNSLPLRASFNTIRHNQNVTTRIFDPNTDIWTTTNHPPVPGAAAGGTLFSDQMAGVYGLYSIYATNTDGAMFRLRPDNTAWTHIGQFTGHRNHYKIDELGFFFRISTDGNDVQRGIAVQRPITPVLLAPATQIPSHVITPPSHNNPNPVVEKNALTQLRYDSVAYSSTQARWEIQTARNSAFTDSVQTQVVSGTANTATLTRTLTEGRWFIRLRVQSSTSQGTNNHWSSWSAVREFLVDLTPPAVTASPASRAADITAVSVNLSFADTGGSRYRHSRHVWSTSTVTPTVWPAWNTSASYNVSQSAVGIWFLHVQAEDNAGNVRTSMFGTYTILEPMAVSALNIDWVSFGAPGPAPVVVMAGAEVRYSVHLTAEAQSVTANAGTGTVSLTRRSGNVWDGIFRVPSTAADGTTYNTTINVTDMVGNGHVFTNRPFVTTLGNVARQFRLRFTR